MRKRHAGFTLVELSIVLVILGLLVGGVLSGQALIKAAELRKSLRSMEQYRTATNTFRDKYFSLPGDLSNAKSFWPTCTDGADALNTCNGNGDGKIDRSNGINIDEEYRAFEHLSLAGLVEGTYNGNSTLGLEMGPIDTKLGRVLLGYDNANGFWPDNRAGNLMIYNSGYISSTHPLATEDIWNLDKKVDDGNGLQGSFRIMPDETPTDGCIDRTTGVYLFANPADYCHTWVFL